MEKFKGTKGAEWVVQEEEQGLHTIWQEETPDDMPVLIARTCYAPKSKENAHLLSASLDLLEAALDFVNKVETGRAKSTDSYNKFKSAIQKALNQ